MFPDMFQMFNQEEESGSGESGSSPQPSPASSSASNVFVLSIGGSVLVESKPNASAIMKFCSCLDELGREGYKFVVVVGGGKPARDYIAAAKSLGANQFVQDEVGIAVTRINASLVAASLEKASPQILADVKDAKTALQQGKTPVFGGLLPGLTTDAVAALAAEFLGAAFVNLSNVDGVYSSDPKTHSNARLYPEISYDRLLSLVKLNTSKPGQNLVLDLVAATILKRSRVPAFFLNGNDLENFKNAVRGSEFHGTRVRDSSEEEARQLQREEERREVARPARRRKRVPRKKKQEEEEEWEGEEELNPDEIEL